MKFNDLNAIFTWSQGSRIIHIKQLNTGYIQFEIAPNLSQLKLRYQSDLAEINDDQVVTSTSMHKIIQILFNSNLTCVTTKELVHDLKTVKTRKNL